MQVRYRTAIVTSMILHDDNFMALHSATLMWLHRSEAHENSVVHRYVSTASQRSVAHAGASGQTPPAARSRGSSCYSACRAGHSGTCSFFAHHGTWLASSLLSR